MKSFLTPLFDAYIQNNYHVAVAVVSLTLVSWHTQYKTPGWPLLLMIFCAVFLSYGFVKNAYLGMGILTRKPLLCVMGTLAGLYFLDRFLLITRHSQILLVSLTALSVLYALPSRWFPLNLRNTPGWKTYAVAISWVGLTAGLGVTEGALKPDFNFVVWMAQLFVLVWVWIIPFEIRDLKFDATSLLTLPQRFGTRRAQWMGTLLLGLVVCGEILKTTQISLTLLLIVVISLIFLWQSSKKKSKYFASFWVESIPIFWWLAHWAL